MRASSPNSHMANLPKLPISKSQSQGKNIGKFSSPPGSPSHLDEKDANQPKLPKVTTSDGKEMSDEQRLVALLDRIMGIDAEDHKNRAILMKSITLFIPNKGWEPKQDIVTKMINLLVSVLSTAPPFSVIQRSYKQIYFNPRESYEDITIAYKLFPIIPLTNYPNQLLKALARRLTSASNNDRSGAKDCLMLIKGPQIPYIIHLIALTLTPPPPHGTKDLLDLAYHFLIEYKPPPPLFDDFFVTSSFDDEKNVLGLNSMISEQRLNDGLTIFNELWCTFRILHYGPHYQSYFQPFLKALTALAKTNEFFAHDIRRFIVNHWPRLDPQKAVLFMQEATALCAEGPPPEQIVWQNLSWRASSIHWQIAMEGMKFVETTINRTEGFDHSILTFLLQDAAKNHWHNGVKTRAEAVLALIPPVAPKRPNLLPFDQWGEIKKIAKKNYPNDVFEPKKMKQH